MQGLVPDGMSIEGACGSLEHGHSVRYDCTGVLHAGIWMLMKQW